MQKGIHRLVNRYKQLTGIGGVEVGVKTKLELKFHSWYTINEQQPLELDESENGLSTGVAVTATADLTKAQTYQMLRAESCDEKIAMFMVKIIE